MKRPKKNSDGTRHRSGKKLLNANKQIGTFGRQTMFVGLDVHKESIQVAAVTDSGETIFNRKIKHDHRAVKNITAKLPDARYVLESSSVWYGLYRYMRDTLHLDVVLSNPYNTKIIAASLKKTDKIDAFQLANLHRGGYIAECYVPETHVIDHRQLIRHRNKFVKGRTKMKNYIHGILLQDGIKIKTSGFTHAHIEELKRLQNYRINDYIEFITHHNKRIARIDLDVKKAVRDDPNAMILTSIPGVGDYTALAISSEIGDISRFSNSHKLCANAGIVPSVRNSADTTHHGRITRRGNSMMRWLLVESVHTHVRYAPNSDISVFYKRIAKKRGKSKAAVAAASKMLRIIYWLLTEQREFVQCHK